MHIDIIYIYIYGDIYIYLCVSSIYIYIYGDIIYIYIYVDTHIATRHVSRRRPAAPVWP